MMIVNEAERIKGGLIMTVNIEEMEILLDCKKYVEKRMEFYEWAMKDTDKNSEKYKILKDGFDKCKSILKC